MAWHYKQYSKDRELASAEVVARKERLSLWDDKSPVAPWEWRKGNRNQNANTKPKRLVPTKEGLSTTVYITKSGKKYHASGCRYLKNTINQYHCLKLRNWACLLARFAGVSINQSARVIPPLFVRFKEVIEF